MFAIYTYNFILAITITSKIGEFIKQGLEFRTEVNLI